MSDLDKLVPQAVEISLAGEIVAIKPLKIGQMTPRESGLRTRVRFRVPPPHSRARIISGPFVFLATTHLRPSCRIEKEKVRTGVNLCGLQCGADCRDRTGDLRVTSALLYQLS